MFGYDGRLKDGCYDDVDNMSVELVMGMVSIGCLMVLW